MTYASLNAEFRLRVLKTPEDYAAAKQFWGEYMADAVLSPRTSESVIEYSEVLSLLMGDYESRLLDAYEEDDEDEEEDKQPAEPDVCDWVTDDYITFRECGGKGVIRVPLGGPWQIAVKDRMDQEQFWSNVWYAEERGGYTLLSLEDDE